MKYTTKELNIYYAKVILYAIQDETEGNESERIAQIMKRFQSEFSWNIKRIGTHKALVEWLQGLAINIPFHTFDIFNMAKETGHLPSSETKKNNLLINYWPFMASKLLWLSNRSQLWFDTNLDKGE